MFEDLGKGRMVGGAVQGRMVGGAGKRKDGRRSWEKEEWQEELGRGRVEGADC